MFRRLHENAAQELTREDAAFTVEVDGKTVPARPGDTVAALLLLDGAGATRRSSVSGEPRAAYCMMGVCFECLVEIDGVASRQGCLVEARHGMRIRLQLGRPEIR